MEKRKSCIELLEEMDLRGVESCSLFTAEFTRLGVDEREVEDKKMYIICRNPERLETFRKFMNELGRQSKNINAVVNNPNLINLSTSDDPKISEDRKIDLDNFDLEFEIKRMIERVKNTYNENSKVLYSVNENIDFYEDMLARLQERMENCQNRKFNLEFKTFTMPGSIRKVDEEIEKLQKKQKYYQKELKQKKTDNERISMSSDILKGIHFIFLREKLDDTFADNMREAYFDDEGER